MFGQGKVSPLGSRRMPSKQQQLYPAVWVKERGLIPPSPRQKPDLPLHAGRELLSVGVAAFPSCKCCRRGHLMANPWAEHGLSLTASSPCGGKGEAGLSPGSGSAAGSCLLGHSNAGEHQALQGSSSPPHWPPPRALGKDRQAWGRAGSSRSHGTGSTMIFQSRFDPSGASKATLRSSVVAAAMWRTPAASRG